MPLYRSAPEFAGANDYVFRELLKLTSAEVSALETLGVTSREPTGSGAH